MFTNKLFCWILVTSPLRQQYVLYSTLSGLPWSGFRCCIDVGYIYCFFKLVGSSVYEFRLEYVFLCYPSLNDTVGCRTCSREIPNF